MAMRRRLYATLQHEGSEHESLAIPSRMGLLIVELPHSGTVSVATTRGMHSRQAIFTPTWFIVRILCYPMGLYWDSFVSGGARSGNNWFATLMLSNARYRQLAAVAIRRKTLISGKASISHFPSQFS